MGKKLAERLRNYLHIFCIKLKNAGFGPNRFNTAEICANFKNKSSLYDGIVISPEIIKVASKSDTYKVRIRILYYVLFPDVNGICEKTDLPYSRRTKISHLRLKIYLHRKSSLR